MCVQYLNSSISLPILFKFDRIQAELTKVPKVITTFYLNICVSNKNCFFEIK